MDNLFVKVKEFIISERWNYDFEITPDTSLQEDLKIFGDDAVEILSKLGKKYNINMKDFKYDEYFRSEPNWIDSLGKKNSFKKLTLGDLVLAIKSGELK